MSNRLFTPRFFTMCGFSFTVFLSAFQMLPTAPFHILDRGGGPVAAGAFLGLLTYASALSAPFTGALADRVGKRRMLVGCSIVLVGFSVSYALSDGYVIPLVLVSFHGIVWSGLLSASSAYMADAIPESRRAEGIGYWGMSTMLAVAVAPSFGFWVFEHGWVWLCMSVGLLNLVMAVIAWFLPETDESARSTLGRLVSRDMVEWRVVVVAFALFLCSFGYGGLTSFVAIFAEQNGVMPKGLFFSTFALTTVVTRVFSGRLADRVGRRRLFLPCLGLVAVSFGLLAVARDRGDFISSAFVFGLGFGNMYPAFVAHVVQHVDPTRRGAAFGGILAAFDTGIGTGSLVVGTIASHFGFRWAWGLSAILASLSIPYFLWAENRYLLRAGDRRSSICGWRENDVGGGPS